MQIFLLLINLFKKETNEEFRDNENDVQNRYFFHVLFCAVVVSINSLGMNPICMQ
jgi:hypothetical protein